MADLNARPGLPLLSDHVHFLRRHRVWIVGGLVVGLLAGLAWSLTRTPQFSATASVALAPVPKYVLPTGEGLSPPEVSIDTDAQLLRSQEVLGAVADVLGTTRRSAAEHLSVTASPNSHVLHTTVSASSPSLAAEAANAAVAALTRARRNTLGALRPDQLRLLRLWTAGQEDLLAEEQGRRVVIPASDDIFAQVLAVRASLQELEEARLAPAEVVRPAVAPTAPDHANAEVPLTSAAMLGGLLGCLVGRRRDRRALLERTAPTPSQGRHAVPAVLTTQG